MKTFTYSLTFFVVLIFFPAFAFAQADGEILIDGVKFVHPILEKWIAEYKKEKPNSHIAIRSGSDQKEDESDLYVLANQGAGDVDENDKVVYVGRYALVPVAHAKNPLHEKAKKGLKKKELTDLLFEVDIYSDDYEPGQKEKYTATFYSRADQAPTTLVLAKHFQRSPESIKGKKIIGDDIYLLNAVQRDETGVTYNTLNYVYDMGSRHLKSDIRVLPLNLKSNQKEALDSQDVDQLIALLEESKIESIPVENFGILIPAEKRGNQELLDFVEWLLSDGQKFNHECGFLSPDENLLTISKRRLKGEDRLSYKN